MISCKYHSHLEDNLSLFDNHSCKCSPIPTKTIQILGHHGEEVWIAEFSKDGKKLATVDEKKKIIIWDVDDNTGKLR